MGKAMALHLISNNWKLYVYNRTASKADELVQQGATYAQSPIELAKVCDVVILMLGHPKDVEDIVLGVDGIKGYMREGAILIDHTSSSPELALRIQDAGIDAIDAPVSGGDIGARNGCLVTMIGGN